MRAAGLESRVDFAFYFSSREEEECEAGTAFANAWEAARAECQHGLAPRVPDLYRRQQPAACPSLPCATGVQPVSVTCRATPVGPFRVSCEGSVRALA